MPTHDPIAAELIALERAALDRWGAGDPSGFLEISAPDVAYFDPFLQQRLDGIDALTAWYEGIRGSVHVDRYDLLNPRVLALQDAAVLSFQLLSYTGSQSMAWNCTEVYRHDPQGWRLVQTHWSITGHLAPTAAP